MVEGQLFIFKLDDDYFGLDLDMVEQIIPYTKITKVPNMPDYIEGIIPMRDDLCTVFNLRKRFSLPDREADENTRIVTVRINSEMIGFIIDNTNEIVHNYEVDAAKNANKKVNKFITGTTDIDGKHINIIAPDRIISA